MASTVPAKSQPLHDFSLPHLIWKNHRTSRHRLAGEKLSSSNPHRSTSTLRQCSRSNVARRPSPLHKQSPMHDSESESDRAIAVEPIGKSSRRIISEKSSKTIEDSKRNVSNKIRIRLPNNGNVKHDEAVIMENHLSTPVNHDAVPSSAAEEEESLPKTWNLRPRRHPMNCKQLNGGLSPLPENRNTNGSNNNHNKEASVMKHIDHSIPSMSKKQKFSIALSRHEIEEDIFSLTGLKPSRRPKKRPRSVQKQLDVSLLNFIRYQFLYTIEFQVSTDEIINRHRFNRTNYSSFSGIS
ncbi:hypothetical protein R6Q57_027640 [Mikania cordata]